MTLTQEITLSAAKALFACAWADWQEENDGVNLSGKEIMDEMPQEIPEAAMTAAYDLVNQVSTLNGQAIETIFAANKPTACGDRPYDADMFGHYLAMQAMGQGVGLRDAFGKAVYEAVNVPDVESIYLDL